MENAEAQVRAIEEFEKLQAGLSVRSGAKAHEKIVGRQNGKVTVEQDVDGAPKGIKRKFEVDEAEFLRLANEEREKTKRLMSEEKSAARKELPSFWAPGETPENKKADIKATKLHPTCPAATPDKPHDFTLKTLVSVHFTEEKAAHESDTNTRSCPSCTKVLSNATKAILAKPCGHVLCRPCSDKFQAPPEKSAHDEEHDDTVRCYVCQEDVTPSRKTRRRKDGEKVERENKVSRGLVELSSEGTGFAGGGKAEVRKGGIAFQC